MKVRVQVELHNSAIRGNTMNKVITIDDDEMEDLDENERRAVIDECVEDAVLNGNMIGWTWDAVTDG